MGQGQAHLNGPVMQKRRLGFCCMNMHTCLNPVNQGEETGLKVWTGTKINPGVVFVQNFAELWFNLDATLKQLQSIFSLIKLV